MSARKSVLGVLGVLGVCWVGFATLHSAKPHSARVLDGCVRCVRFARVRACVRKKIAAPFQPIRSGVFSLRENLKNLTNLTHLTQML